MIMNPNAGGGGGGDAVVTGRLNSYDITVYGETDNGIIKFDYFTDYNVRLGSMLVCRVSAYGSGTPSGLEEVGSESMGFGNYMFVLKVTGNFVIYSF